MASNPEAVRRAAQAEMARRELQRRQFKGPIPTGQELADSRPRPVKPPSLWEAGLMAANPATRGVAETALSIGSGMVSAPINSFWNAAMEAGEFPTGQPVPTYTPRSPEGQQILGGIGRALEPVTSRMENAMGLNDHDPAIRATGNLMEGLAGVLPAVGSVKALRARRAAAVPSRAEIRTAANAAYDRAEQAGGVLPQSNLGGFVNKAEQMLVKEGFDQQLNPKTYAAVQRFMDEATKPGIQGHSAQGAEILRRVLLNAEKEAPLGSADARLASKLVDEFDDFIDQTLPTSTSEYRTARALWNTQRKSQDIEALFERAQNRSGQYSISGMENALTTEFRQLANNPRRLGRFSPEEQAAIKEVARGSFTQNTLRFLGKFSPRGGIQSLATYGTMAIDPFTGAVVAGVGEASRLGASALRTRAANNVDRLVRSGANRNMAPRVVPGNPATGIGYLPANALATQEAANALYELDRPRRNALAR